MFLHPKEFVKAVGALRDRAHPTILLYHPDTVNHCPGCGGRHWHIGRSTAECAFCATALPLDSASKRSSEPRFAVDLKIA